MPNIEINANNIKKFAKRLQKNVVDHNIELTLSQSQELLAKTLGSTNFNELIKKFEPINSDSNVSLEVNTPEKNQYVFDRYLFLITSFKELLKKENSSISMCTIEHIDDFEYGIYLKSYFNHSYTIDFHSISFNKIESDIIGSGFSKEDASEIKLILRVALTSPENGGSGESKSHLTSVIGYESLMFAKKLWNYLDDNNTPDKKIHVLKIDLNSTSNKEYVLIDDEYYSKYSYKKLDFINYKKYIAPFITKSKNLTSEYYDYSGIYNLPSFDDEKTNVTFYILMNVTTRKKDHIQFIEKPDSFRWG